MRRRYLVLLAALALGILGWLRCQHRGGAPGGSARAPASESARRGVLKPPGFSFAPLREPRATILGRVTDSGGRGLAGAWVCAAGESPQLSAAETGEPTCVAAGPGGAYRLEGLFAGRWQLDASAADHAPGRYRERERAFLDLAPGETRPGIDLVLRPGGVEVRGRVQDLGGGPVPGARVRVASGVPWSWEAPLAATRADDRGEWRVWVAPGPIVALARARGYADGTRRATVPGSFVEILLTPESILVGRAVEAAGEPGVPGALVTIYRDGAEEGPTRTVTSGPDGRFRAEGLAPGRYKPVAETADRHGVARESVLLGLAQTSAEVLVPMYPASGLVARVLVAGDDAPCPGGLVELLADASRERAWARIGGGGEVVLRGLLPGRYQVLVSCPGWVPEEHYSPVEALGQPLPAVVWRVRRGQHIAGVVVSAGGEPVAVATLTAALVEGDPRGQRTPGSAQPRPDGSFQIAGLLPGDYAVHVTVWGQPTPREPVKVTLPPGRNVDGLRIVLDPAGTIEGAVVDADGAPVAGAEVRAQGTEWAWSDELRARDDGSFRLSGLRPGWYRVVASRGWDDLRAPGTADDELQGARAEVKPGAIARVRLTVERQSGQITGRVSAAGKPVTDAFVDAYRESESAAAEEGSARRWVRAEWLRPPTLTDTTGRFTLTRLAPGRYTLRAYRKGGGEAVAEHVAVGADVSLVIRPTGQLAGTVSVVGRVRPERFGITLEDPGEGLRRHEEFWRTGGRWTLRDLPAGKFRISAEASDGAAATEVTLAEGQTRGGIALVLAPRASLRGRVVALETGKPLPGIRVLAQPPSATGELVFTSREAQQRLNITDVEGRFEIGDAPTGKVMVYLFPVDLVGGAYEGCFSRATLPPGAVVDLPPIRCARRRVGVNEAGGDLGFDLKSVPPAALIDPVAQRVAVVRPGGPAAAAGLRAGDVIVAVDGVPVTGNDDHLFWPLVRVPAGTAIRLGLARGATLALTAAAPP